MKHDRTGRIFFWTSKKSDESWRWCMLFIHLLLRTLSPYLFLCLLLFFPFWLPLFKLECLFSQDFFAQNRLISMTRACRSFEHSAVSFEKFVVGCGSLFWKCYQCDFFKFHTINFAHRRLAQPTVLEGVETWLGKSLLHDVLGCGLVDRPEVPEMVERIELRFGGFG